MKKFYLVQLLLIAAPVFAAEKTIFPTKQPEITCKYKTGKYGPQITYAAEHVSATLYLKWQRHEASIHTEDGHKEAVKTPEQVYYSLEHQWKQQHPIQHMAMHICSNL